MRRPALLLIAVLASACSTSGQRIDQLAQTAGLSRTVIDAEGFPTLIYMKRVNGAADAPYTIFLEGDGRPRDGNVPSTDPTTRNPLALRLLLRTPQAGAYVARPCYQEQLAPACTPELWTSARYSEQVVSSLTSAVRQVAQHADARKIVLVGYSGGGALAVLIAERLDNVAAVITISANLDTEAWTSQQHYLPLAESLNPAQSTREHPWPEIHLHGARDSVVPTATTAAYFERYPAAKNVLVDKYDHVCCWVDRWPTLFATLSTDIGK
jgi:pimeloyl-ACP methyl ester carboxylesterase